MEDCAFSGELELDAAVTLSILDSMGIGYKNDRLFSSMRRNTMYGKTKSPSKELINKLISDLIKYISKQNLFRYTLVVADNPQI